MRTYILFGYVIIALQCLQIHCSISHDLHFPDSGSGDGENPLFTDTDWPEEEESGSGSNAYPVDGHGDAEEDEIDEYYGYEDEGSGVYPVPVDNPDKKKPNDIPTHHDDDLYIDPEDRFPHEEFVNKDQVEPKYENPSFEEVIPVEKPSTTQAPTLTDSHPDMDTNIRILSQNDEERQVSVFAQPTILAAFIGGAVAGLLCAILLVMFIVYRMRKRDEGSYPLDEPKRVPLTSSYAPNDKEIYA